MLDNKNIRVQSNDNNINMIYNSQYLAAKTKEEYLNTLRGISWFTENVERRLCCYAKNIQFLIERVEGKSNLVDLYYEVCPRSSKVYALNCEDFSVFYDSEPLYNIMPNKNVLINIEKTDYCNDVEVFTRSNGDKISVNGLSSIIDEFIRTYIDYLVLIKKEESIISNCYFSTTNYTESFILIDGDEKYTGNIFYSLQRNRVSIYSLAEYLGIDTHSIDDNDVKQRSNLRVNIVFKILDILGLGSAIEVKEFISYNSDTGLVKLGDMDINIDTLKRLVLNKEISLHFKNDIEVTGDKWLNLYKVQQKKGYCQVGIDGLSEDFYKVKYRLVDNFEVSLKRAISLGVKVEKGYGIFSSAYYRLVGSRSVTYVSDKPFMLNHLSESIGNNGKLLSQSLMHGMGGHVSIDLENVLGIGYINNGIAFGLFQGEGEIDRIHIGTCYLKNLRYSDDRSLFYANTEVVK